jgi:hypothetical protein
MSIMSSTDVSSFELQCAPKFALNKYDELSTLSQHIERLHFGRRGTRYTFKFACGRHILLAWISGGTVKMIDIQTLPLEDAQLRLEALVELAAIANKQEPDELPEMEALFKRIWDIKGNISGIPFDAFENDACPDPLSFRPLKRVWRYRQGLVWR